MLPNIEMYLLADVKALRFYYDFILLMVESNINLTNGGECHAEKQKLN